MRESKRIFIKASSPLHNNKKSTLWLTLKRHNYFSIFTPLERPLPKWGENPLIYTWIQDKQLISTIHFPLNLSLKILNLSLQILQQILDEIFSPYFHNPLLEISLNYLFQILKRWIKHSGIFWILLGWKLQLSLH